MRRLARVAMILAGLGLLSPFASAYYYWIYFAGRSGPFTAIPVKFDLAAGDQHGVQNNTVPFMISTEGPTAMMPGDTFSNLVNQIRAAANVWNSVGTSAIRLAFGGLSPMTTPDTAPEVDVVFSPEIQPGLLALTLPTTVDVPAAYLANGATALPIVNSQLQLRQDLTVYTQSSWSDTFFLVIVHEFGHSLGLQHTLTSSVMSTQITAATTAAAPLAADDIAGISLLYPAGGYPAGLGRISGTVSLNGNGVNLASVVALSTNGTAISTLTNPDGTYQISGIPAGQYYVYAHPLPPAAEGEAYPDNIHPPQDLTGDPFPANTSFGTQFYGGTTDWTQTPQVTVTAGNTSGSINFSVAGRPGPAVSSMTTYAYLGPNGQTPVSQPDVPASWYGWLVFTANGIVGNGNQVAPGLNVSVIGGAAQVNPATLAFFEAVPQSNGTVADYLQIALYPNSQIQTPTPTALAVTLNGDLYVLPAAFTVVPNAAPAITSVTGTTDNLGNATATIYGSNLNQSTRIMFDDSPATLVRVNSDGSLLVSAPPATAGYKAAVEALSSDNQTSSQALGNSLPAQFTYGAPAYPTISLNQLAITEGTDQMVQVNGYNTNFAQGQVQVGFGSSEIAVKSVWVINPGLLWMNISASAAAPAGTTSITVASGLQVETLSNTFQIAAANPGQASLMAPILNQATGLPGVPAGGVALINTTGLPSSLTGWTLTISNQPATFSFVNGQIIAPLPPGLLLGETVVQLTSPNGMNVPPVVIEIDPPSPAVISAADGAVALNATNAANPGDTVTLTVENLADADGNYPAPSDVSVTIAGIAQTVISVTPVNGQGAATIQFTISPGVPSGEQQLTVMVGNRGSGTYAINIGS
ncbi:MAG TPA: matrixin family metalloprotease [Bryobacteraceae bacterium]|nr:matrixin family metalloprotease [Bryobacteraceae bacterium]